MSVLPWIGFLVPAILRPAFYEDRGVLHRRAQELDTLHALRAIACGLALALCVDLAVYFMHARGLVIGTQLAQPQSGARAAAQLLTAYVMERSLSVDPVLVLAIISGYLATSSAFQHRVLLSGILGALVFRGVFSGAGLTFIDRFGWANYALGGILVVTALRLLLSKQEGVHPDKHALARPVQCSYPLTSEYHGDRPLVRIAGELTAIPLCRALAWVVSSGSVPAAHSVPAVFGSPRDSFITFSRSLPPGTGEGASSNNPPQGLRPRTESACSSGSD